MGPRHNELAVLEWLGTAIARGLRQAGRVSFIGGVDFCRRRVFLANCDGPLISTGFEADRAKSAGMVCKAGRSTGFELDHAQIAYMLCKAPLTGFTVVDLVKIATTAPRASAWGPKHWAHRSCSLSTGGSKLAL